MRALIAFVVTVVAGLAVVTVCCGVGSLFLGSSDMAHSPRAEHAKAAKKQGQGAPSQSPAAERRREKQGTRSAETVRQETGLGTTQAFQTARETLRPHLRHPDDAEFHSYFGDTTVRSDKAGLTWQVASKVKAANGLGVPITVPYEVHLDVNRFGEFDVTYIRLDDAVLLDERATPEAQYRRALSEAKWLDLPMAYQSFVANEIYAWIESHGQIPPQEAGQSIVERYVDENGVAGKYLPDDDGFDIRFAGPDGKHDTEDDFLLQNGVLEEILTSRPSDSLPLGDDTPARTSTPDLPSMVPPSVRDKRPRKPIDFDEQEMRLWASEQGGFTARAQLLRFDPEADSVQLRRADGQELTVSLKQLSLGDRNYVRGLAREAE